MRAWYIMFKSEYKMISTLSIQLIENYVYECEWF